MKVKTGKVEEETEKLKKMNHKQEQKGNRTSKVTFRCILPYLLR